MATNLDMVLATQKAAKAAAAIGNDHIGMANIVVEIIETGVIMVSSDWWAPEGQLYSRYATTGKEAATYEVCMADRIAEIFEAREIEANIEAAGHRLVVITL